MLGPLRGGGRFFWLTLYTYLPTCSLAIGPHCMPTASNNPTQPDINWWRQTTLPVWRGIVVDTCLFVLWLDAIVTWYTELLACNDLNHLCTFFCYCIRFVLLRCVRLSRTLASLLYASHLCCINSSIADSNDNVCYIDSMQLGLESLPSSVRH